MKTNKTIEDMIYTMEKISYYFGLTPHEFWDLTYKEAELFCNCRVAYNNDRLKEEIIVQDAVSDKMIKANPIMNKRPKCESLTKIFKDLFKKESPF